MLQWARDLDRDLVAWLEHLLHLPLRDGPVPTWALLTPPFRGGLGLTPLVIEVLLHCLSGRVALTAAGEHPMTRDEAADADLARHSLLDLVTVDALTCGAHLLPHRRVQATSPRGSQTAVLATDNWSPWGLVRPRARRQSPGRRHEDRSP